MQCLLGSREEESIRCRRRRDDEDGGSGGFVGFVHLFLVVGIGFWEFGGDGFVWMVENLAFWIFFRCDLVKVGLDLKGFGVILCLCLVQVQGVSELQKLLQTITSAAVVFACEGRKCAHIMIRLI